MNKTTIPFIVQREYKVLLHSDGQAEFVDLAKLRLAVPSVDVILDEVLNCQDGIMAEAREKCTTHVKLPGDLFDELYRKLKVVDKAQGGVDLSEAYQDSISRRLLAELAAVEAE